MSTEARARPLASAFYSRIARCLPAIAEGAFQRLDEANSFTNRLAARPEPRSMSRYSPL
jgi:hypothetical protein